MTDPSLTTNAVIGLGLFSFETFWCLYVRLGRLHRQIRRGLRHRRGAMSESAAAGGPSFSDATTSVILLLFCRTGSSISTEYQKAPPRRSKPQIWVCPYRCRRGSPRPSLLPCSWGGDDISTSDVPFSPAQRGNLPLVGQYEGRLLGSRLANNARPLSKPAHHISDLVVHLRRCRSGGTEAPCS